VRYLRTVHSPPRTHLLALTTHTPTSRPVPYLSHPMHQSTYCTVSLGFTRNTDIFNFHIFTSTPSSPRLTGLVPCGILAAIVSVSSPSVLHPPAHALPCPPPPSTHLPYPSPPPVQSSAVFNAHPVPTLQGEHNRVSTAQHTACPLHRLVRGAPGGGGGAAKRNTQQPEYDRLRVQWADYALWPLPCSTSTWLPGGEKGQREERTRRGQTR
jgi:hypothetical protein